MKGVDGTSEGWIAADFDGETWKLEFLEDLRSLSEPALIDIPIGLPEDSVRNCDQEARSFLSPHRHYSVFNCPVRKAVYSESYEKACRINEERTDRRISKQAWNITPKIIEADRAVRSGATFVESHPEVIFKQLSPEAVKSSKSSDEGKKRRRQVLDDLGRVPVLSEFDGRNATEDDLFDAMILAYAAEQKLSPMPESPPRDSEGLEMKIMRLDRSI